VIQPASTATFSEFAKRTLIQAQRAHGRRAEAEAIRSGWEAVKVPL